MKHLIYTNLQDNTTKILISSEDETYLETVQKCILSYVSYKETKEEYRHEFYIKRVKEEFFNWKEQYPKEMTEFVQYLYSNLLDMFDDMNFDI